MSDLDEFSRDIAAHVRAYLTGVEEIATGESPETAVSGLLVQLAQVSMAGAMLGAVTDVVPADRFEEDAGPDPDADPLRESLGRLLEGVDDIALTLKSEDAIAAYERERERSGPVTTSL